MRAKYLLTLISYYITKIYHIIGRSTRALYLENDNIIVQSNISGNVLL